ncbi:MAG: AMP-binding protein, partial [Betaproteobacteria bacterium]|nr:AMP-binding protein [Betaproteobacteria bacterium]
MRVEQFLRDSNRRFPEKIAVVAGDRRLTFREIDVASDRLAAALRRHGVTRGDRVVVFMDNRWEAVVGIFAVLKAGAVFSPINPSTKADKLAYLLNNCRAAALITLGSLLPVARDALAEAPSVKLAVVTGAAGKPAVAGGIRFEDALAEPGIAPSPDAAGIELDLAMLI